MKLTTLIVTGLAAAAVAVPVAGASNDRVQVAGSFVAPGQVSEAQVNAGHDPATRLVQIGGKLVAPSQVSAYQSGTGSSPTASAGSDSSSGLSTSSITAIAVLGAFAALIVGSAVVLRRHRRSPVAA